MRIFDCCISLEWNEARSCISNSVSFLGLIETSQECREATIGLGCSFCSFFPFGFLFKVRRSKSSDGRLYSIEVREWVGLYVSDGVCVDCTQGPSDKPEVSSIWF